MSNVVPHNLVADRVDKYFKAQRSESGNYISIKLPWQKTRKWIETAQYHRFRNNLIEQTMEGGNNDE